MVEDVRALLREMALETLSSLEKKYETTNDGVLLIEAIRHCARMDIVMPEWLAVAFLARTQTIIEHEVRSWDDVFGKYLKSNSKIERIKWRRKHGLTVAMRCFQLIKENPDTPIDNLFFEDVGKEFGIKKTLTSEIYSEWSVKLKR